MTESGWMTASDAAEVVMTTPWLVYRYGVAGRLRTRRVKGQVLYLATDVTRLAQELLMPHPASPPGDSPTELALDLFKRSNAAMRDIQGSLTRQSVALKEVDTLMGPPARSPRSLRFVLICMGLITLLLLAIVLLLLAGEAR
jgi:hypothetical protein